MSADGPSSEPGSEDGRDAGAAASSRPGPLTGTRGVEITRYVQGPVAGLMLAALGAEVTKIELVGRQDSMRSGVQLHGVQLGEQGRAWLDPRRSAPARAGAAAGS